MTDSSTSLHESEEQLTGETLERHRAIVSLMEELEAIDWYQQRIDACDDPELARILAHNRDEEKEHAAMALEWLRRRDPKLDEELRAYLFTDGPIAGRREHGQNDEDSSCGSDSSSDGSLGIGSLELGNRP